jgi:hypothetical protein
LKREKERRSGESECNNLPAFLERERERERERENEEKERAREFNFLSSKFRSFQINIKFKISERKKIKREEIFKERGERKRQVKKIIHRLFKEKFSLFSL